MNSGYFAAHLPVATDLSLMGFGGLQSSGQGPSANNQFLSASLYPNISDYQGQLLASNLQQVPGSESLQGLDDFTTDEFRMFRFKIVQCPKRFPHDWRTCPFAHATENARRRDPNSFRYCAIPCPAYKQGFCAQGDNCPYAHGIFECWLHPSRYRTQFCKDGAYCNRPLCFFAHAPDQLRMPTHTWVPEEAANGSLPAVELSQSELDSPFNNREVMGEKLPSMSGNVTSPMLSHSSSTAAPLSLSSISSTSLGARSISANMIYPPSNVSTPRMSNAFARKHGLNIRDPVSINIQKLNSKQSDIMPSGPRQLNPSPSLPVQHSMPSQPLSHSLSASAIVLQAMTQQALQMSEEMSNLKNLHSQASSGLGAGHTGGLTSSASESLAQHCSEGSSGYPSRSSSQLMSGNMGELMALQAHLAALCLSGTNSQWA